MRRGLNLMPHRTSCANKVCFTAVLSGDDGCHSPAGPARSARRRPGLDARDRLPRLHPGGRARAHRLSRWPARLPTAHRGQQRAGPKPGRDRRGDRHRPHRPHVPDRRPGAARVRRPARGSGRPAQPADRGHRRRSCRLGPAAVGTAAGRVAPAGGAHADRVGDAAVTAAEGRLLGPGDGPTARPLRGGDTGAGRPHARGPPDRSRGGAQRANHHPRARRRSPE